MELLTVHEVAQMLKVNPVTVRRYISSGQLPALRVGRRVRVRAEVLEAFARPISAVQQPASPEQYRFRRPSSKEIERRKALFQTIVTDRTRRLIAPLTSADLVHLARDEEEEKYGRD